MQSYHFLGSPDWLGGQMAAYVKLYLIQISVGVFGAFGVFGSGANVVQVRPGTGVASGLGTSSWAGAERMQSAGGTVAPGAVPRVGPQLPGPRWPTGHGLRAGWVSDRRREGAPDATIMREGRWLSIQAMLKYDRTTLGDLIHRSLRSA